MTRRLPYLFALVMMWFAASCAPAFAWSNGPDGADGFGTHDWILYQAIQQAGATWVEPTTAMLASDDPDTRFPMSDRPNHAYRLTGTWRGGPQAVADYYHLAMSAYEAGDRHMASYYFGLMSHYYSDLCVPYHTAYSAGHEIWHLRYELEVDRYFRRPSDNESWITTAPRLPVDDVRSKAVATAMETRGYYESMAINYDSYGYDAVVDAVTRMSLSRAINGLADMLVALPAGTGRTTAGGLSTNLSFAYPHQDQTITASAVCRTADGRRAEAARIVFTWNLPTGPVTKTAFSDSDGVAKSSCNVGSTPKGMPTTVTAETAASGVTKTAVTWFTPTDPLGDLFTTVSSAHPTQGTTVTAIARCINEYGEPVPDLKVTFYWVHQTKTLTYTTFTDFDGIALHTRNIGKASAGKSVSVRARVPAGGVVRSAWASFTPKAPPKPKKAKKSATAR